MSGLRVDAPRPDAVAKRLVLDPDELHVLLDLTGLRLPPGFTAPTAPTPQEAGDGPPLSQRLLERGLVRHGDDGALEVVPALLANLLVLAAPAASVSVEGSRAEGALKAGYAVRGGLGASLFLLPGGRIELSVFEDIGLGDQLVRAVPEPLSAGSTPRLNLGPNGGAGAGAGDGVEGDGTDAAEAGATTMAGRYPLAVLAGPSGLAEDQFGVSPELDRLEAPARDRVRWVRSHLDAELRFLAIGKGRDGLVATPMLWVGAGPQWYAVDPVPSTAAELDAGLTRMVRLVPVAREQVGTWLAPGIAAALTASADAVNARPEGGEG